MTKLKNPLLSFSAQNTIAKTLTFLRRRKVNVVEEKPQIPDARSLAQLSWRHMYQKGVALWHALSAPEQFEWQSAASRHHMTGFAYFMSQCLKPNPGLYLPLQGGIMTGDIDMATNRIRNLPAPLAGDEAIRLIDYLSYILPYLSQYGCRVYNNANINLPHNTHTALTFNTQRWDTDTIHSTVVNPNRLTCKHAGRYLIVVNVKIDGNAAGFRNVYFRYNGGDIIGENRQVGSALTDNVLTVSTVWDLNVNDYVETIAWQDSGGALNCVYTAKYSPEFMMERIGA